MSTPAMGEIIQRQFDELRVVRISGEGQRSAAVPTVAESTRWPFLVAYAVAGHGVLTHRGRPLDLQAGALAVVANSAPYTIELEPGAVLLLVQVPDGAVKPYGKAFQNAEGRQWSAGDGATSLVGHLLGGLASQLADYSPVHPGQLSRHIVGFVGLVCTEVPSPVGGSGDRILQRAKEYVEDHLGDLELGPDRVAAVHNVSTRTLHRLFEREQLTLSGWIRSRRLDHCRSDLEDPARDPESVSSIGSRWGYWDAAHFSRLFKAEYGMSPREYRTSRDSRRPYSDAPQLASA